VHVLPDRAMKVFPRSTRPPQQGFSLVELMIAMGIGLTVLGAVMAAYIASTSTTRTSRAVALMTEDATVAPAATGTGLARAAGTAPADWLIGCDKGFADLTQPIASLTCSTAAAGTNAVAVAYEASKENTMTTVKSGKTVPTDCLGAGLTETTSGAYKYYQSYSRFYVSGSQLYCLGVGNATAQPLVENIAEMQVRYGVGGAVSPDTTRVITYTDAAGVAALGPWSRVLAVRVCLVVRSADALPEIASSTYRGCDPFVAVTAPDKHLYRAFTTTILLHNRV
jgi:type IV pilus assembly protein PilW